MMNPDDVAEIYRIDKSKVQHIEHHKQREPTDAVRIEFAIDGSIKRYAWKFAEPLVRSGKAVIIEDLRGK